MKIQNPTAHDRAVSVLQNIVAVTNPGTQSRVVAERALDLLFNSFDFSFDVTNVPVVLASAKRTLEAQASAKLIKFPHGCTQRSSPRSAMRVRRYRVPDTSLQYV